MNRICHFTSVHNQLDDRIYLKECISLHESGYEVYIVAKGDSCNKNGINIVGCGLPNNRFDRILFFSKRIYKAALKLDCDIYHFHDPELLPYGLRLKKKGKIVIFDSHEDVPSQIMDKHWIPKVFRTILSLSYKKYESFVVKRIDAVIAATEHISQCFFDRARKVEIINNYPKLDDIVFQEQPFCDREKNICYVGGVSAIRGEKVMVDAMKRVDANFIIAGTSNIESIENSNYNDRFIRYIGQVSRDGVNDIYSKSIGGLLLYQPAKNHFESQPIKMFEYMAAGLPVIASDFPLWKEILEKNKCGICVDCTDVNAVVSALTILLNDLNYAQEMGKNGRLAVVNTFNWDCEKTKLLELYRRLMKE